MSMAAPVQGPQPDARAGRSSNAPPPPVAGNKAPTAWFNQPVDKSGRSDLNQQFERLEKKLPGGMGRFVRWLREPSSRWVRIPAAILLIAAGFIGFLPILGFWMVPLGLVLIAQDIPFMRKPIARLIDWLLTKWERWKRSRGR
jgi:hypothetical protein